MCVDHIFGVDTDLACAYTAPRMVRIKSRVLGLINYGIMTLIFIYIFAVNLMVRKQYLENQPIVGNTRLTLTRPEPQYWDTDSAFCGTGTFPVDRPGMSPLNVARLPCRFLDAIDVVSPPVEANAMFIKTGAWDLEQQVNDTQPGIPGPTCNAHMPKSSCTWAPSLGVAVVEQEGIPRNESYYVGDIELFSLTIEHAMTVPGRSALVRNFPNLNGREMKSVGLLAEDGWSQQDACSAYTSRDLPCPPYIQAFGQAGAYDVVPLGTVLDMAGISSLDALSSDKRFTLRQRGLVIQLTIEYTNRVSFDTQNLEYSISATRLSDVEFMSLASSMSDDTHRIVHLRPGVRLLVVQTGTVGAFSLGALWVQGLTFLLLAYCVQWGMDVVVNHCLQMSPIYFRYRVVDSVDFSNLGDQYTHILKQFQGADPINPKPAIFARLDQGGVVVRGAPSVPGIATQARRASDTSTNFELVASSGGQDVPGGWAAIVSKAQDDDSVVQENPVQAAGVARI